MEIDQQEGAGQDQEQVMSSEEQGGGNQSTPRYYECTFCKRGFTNAQALGGHMNIHRKEKAKLKKSTLTPTSLSLNTMAGDTSKMIPSPAAVVSSTTAAESHGSVDSGLDLELRLGPEPHNKSTPSSAPTGSSTKHLF